MIVNSDQIIGDKLDGNELCLCPSGLKYKECCYKRGIEIRKMSDELYRELTTRKSKHIAATELGTSYYLFHIQSEYRHLRVRTLHTRVFYRPIEETFHEFVMFVLMVSLSQEWIDAQRNIGIQEQHFIFRCFEHYLKWQDKIKAIGELTATGRYSGYTDGYTQWLICLAFDIYCLMHSKQLDITVLKKLKSSNDQFQGARYEIAVAAIFARAGFKIEFYDEKDPNVVRTRHCEFIAEDPESGFRIAVEAKSRHRPGVMHDKKPQASEKRYLKGDIHQLLRDAMGKEIPPIPYMIFIDLNAPHTPDLAPKLKPWLKDIVTKIGQNTTELNQGKANLISITNFSYHYQKDTPSIRGEFINSHATLPDYPIPQSIFDKFLNVFEKYGLVPDLDKHYFK